MPGGCGAVVESSALSGEPADNRLDSFNDIVVRLADSLANGMLRVFEARTVRLANRFPVGKSAVSINLVEWPW